MVKLPEELSEDYLRKYLSKGDVLSWDYFEFPDGGRKTSRFLILTSCKDSSFLAIRATTRIEFYKKRGNIYREFLYIKRGQESVFPEETVIDLNAIYLLHVEKMKKSFGANITKMERVSAETLQRLEDLVKKSKIIRQDWIDRILQS